MDWTEIVVTVEAEKIEQASDIALMVVPYGIYVEDYRNLESETQEIAHTTLIDENLLTKDRSKGLVHIYIPPHDNPSEAVEYLSERLTAAEIRHETKTVPCKKADWENNWKAYFKPVPVGEKLLIRPAWEDGYNQDGRTILNIDPGLAFGTGTHETTKLCLEAIETIVSPEKTVLDIGCGSGILSIAALLLGAKSATAVDIDPLAVKTAKQNAEKNNIDPRRYTVLEGNLADKVSGTYDIIITNIVADVIVLFCQKVAEFMNRDSVFITSGIIDMRENDVLCAFEKNGFAVRKCREKNGWVCFECTLKNT